LLDHARLLDTAARQASDFASSSHSLPAIKVEQSSSLASRPADVGPARPEGVRSGFSPANRRGKGPRVFAIARAYLDSAGRRVDQETCSTFLNGFQQAAPLEIDEIRDLQPALLTEILARLEHGAAEISELIASLRHIGEIDWDDLVESASEVDRVLAADP